MNTVKSTILAGLASAALMGGVAAPALAQQSRAAERVPIEVWSLRDVVNHVEVSPDGKHILVLKTKSREGNYWLEIYSTDNLSEPMRTLTADPMEIFSAQWVTDNHIYGRAWDTVRTVVKGPEDRTFEFKGYIYNLEKNKFSTVSDDLGLVEVLPNEPTKILVSTDTTVGDSTGVDPFREFRPRSYYKLDLGTGRRELILKGSENFRAVAFDNEGNPRFTQSRERGSNIVTTLYRLPGEKSWREMKETFDQDEQENLYRFLGGFMGIKGYKADDPTIGYVVDSRGEDKAALWEFDFKTGEYGEKLASTPDADILGIQTHSVPGNDKLAAAVFAGPKYERAWFDAEEKALHDALLAQIPNAHQLAISSRSRDGKTMIVYNEGPRDPGSFWLVDDGKLGKLGSRNPLLKPEQLADVEFIKYPARDGQMVPAYVTKPAGEGPFPLVVVPHGGPHVTEVIGYDEWGQMLANAGYMVLQPQYRMSVGWGQEHFDSAYGQHGLAMQDDKDDGAQYLVDQGLVDPDRIAMFGWSYGGYAALVAASREPNLYQCVIAGAAVADPEKVYMMRRSPYNPKALDEWSKRRGMIGINPIKEVDKINVPLLIMHPKDDSRVLYFNFTDYKKAVEKAGKTAKFLTVDGADHFSITHRFEHQEMFYSAIFDFLENDCGPGGL